MMMSTKNNIREGSMLSVHGIRLVVVHISAVSSLLKILSRSNHLFLIYALLGQGSHSVCLSVTMKSAAYLVYTLKARCHQVPYGAF